jgi:hypothetical protein
MREQLMTDNSDFFYPRSRYHGDFTPEHVVFNANLQEFAQKVTYICNLETNGKLPPETAYQEIKALWKQLKLSRRELNIRETPS